MNCFGRAFRRANCITKPNFFMANYIYVKEPLENAFSMAVFMALKIILRFIENYYTASCHTFRTLI